MTTQIGTEEAVETGLDILEMLSPFEENEDPNLKAHIINPPKNLHIWEVGMEMQDVVALARMNQIELIALCGHRFIPKHNPEKCDVCEPCIELAGDLMRSKDE